MKSDFIAFKLVLLQMGFFLWAGHTAVGYCYQSKSKPIWFSLFNRKTKSIVTTVTLKFYLPLRRSLFICRPNKYLKPMEKESFNNCSTNKAAWSSIKIQKYLTQLLLWPLWSCFTVDPSSTPRPHLSCIIANLTGLLPATWDSYCNDLI